MPLFPKRSGPGANEERNGWLSCFDGGMASEYTLFVMQPLKARVRNGRLLLDEPTDLPEGEVVELLPAEQVLAHGGDDLDDEERAALHAELRASIADANAGNLIDAKDALAELRAMK